MKTSGPAVAAVLESALAEAAFGPAVADLPRRDHKRSLVVEDPAVRSDFVGAQGGGLGHPAGGGREGGAAHDSGVRAEPCGIDRRPRRDGAGG